MSNVIKVGISDLNIARAPDVLVTFALGSCVGICLYDARNKLGGLAHIMLPWSNPNAGPNDNKYRYADTCIAELITLMMRQGSAPSLMTAKIAGGAQMFQASSNPLSAFNIGERNVDAVKQTLAKHKIRIIAEDTGDNFGRTEYFYVQTGVVEVKTASSRLIVL